MDAETPFAANSHPDVFTSPLVLRLGTLGLTEDQFFELCQRNDLYRLERTSKGDLLILPLCGWETSYRNAELTAQLAEWTRNDGSGAAADSSVGYLLPNTAVRSPDASWLLKSRLAGVTAAQREKFLPLCPDFAAELRSPSDRLTTLKAKMREYLANGARLGLLLDPVDRKVYVYRPGQSVITLNDPATTDCSPELPGFVLDVQAVFDPSS
jgi:Uma2 family endonuclease